ncbi:MAG TPA: prolipoprotein diacylglyceryl transferase [Gaiellaceae bacterium]|nr:prolipoprotein diacylglyceryl transferase [Gaiellaceae bacterium]
MIAAIPSPPTGVYHLGPLTLHMYGVMLLLAIAACVWLTGRRWVAWGGEWDLVYRVAIWGVIAGIVGARLYHVVTSWNDTSHAGWYWPLAVWKGGLGIWGGILFGVTAGAWIVSRSGNSVRLFMDAVAPGLLLAQAIGRWGNWWNQELYGKHTTLPWGLEIHGKGALNTYHPTFLYEFLWNLLGVGVLLWVDRRFKLRRPALFALYVMWYTAFRIFEETLRVDPSGHLWGQRTNFWVSIVVLAAASSFFVWWQFLRRPAEEPRARKGPRPPKARRRRRLRREPEPPKPPTMAVPRGRVR